jgi:hypothetical protein
LRASKENLKPGASDIEFHVKSLDNPDVEVTETGRFLSPVKR